MPENESGFRSSQQFGRDLEISRDHLRSEIYSSLHKHPLKLIGKGANERIKCDGCQGDDFPSGMIYGCRPCLFFLHVSCTEHLESIEILCHPCILTPRVSPRFCCDLCGQFREGFSYHCARCSFNADLECATKTQRQISHFSHPHPLSLHSRIFGRGEWCNFCQQNNEGLAYKCEAGKEGCKDFHLHQSCMYSLKQKIQHVSHPCSLFLHTFKSYKCEVCKQPCEGFAFHCGRYECRGFRMCGTCYMMPIIRRRTSIDEKEKIQTFEFKGDRMTLRELNPEWILGELLCRICQELCSGPAYVCRRIGVFHESCILLPRQIDSHYHGRNLYLKEAKRWEACKMCDGDCYPYRYFCLGEGHINLDARCSLLKPTIKWSRHEHLLVVVNSSRRRVRLGSFSDEPTHEITCKRCHIPLVVGSYPMMRCFSCDYATHLLCGPLPCIIKHKCHIHPLTLMDYVIDDDRDDFCCHVCEEHRDPYLCVYYCLGCRFVAEVGCVISEVIASLRGKQGNVKLRTTGRRTKCELIIEDLKAKEDVKEANRRSFQEILREMDFVDRNQWHFVVGSVGMASKRVDHHSLETKEGVNVLSYFKLGYKSLKANYVPEEFPTECISSFFESYKDEEFVIRGNYFVAETLIPSFEYLLAKYGDFTAKSKKNPAVKLLCLLVLLDYMQKLRRTSVENERTSAENEKVEDHNIYQKFTEYAGFETQFIGDYIDRMTRIRSILQIEKQIDEASLKLGKQNLTISGKMRKLSEQKETNTRTFEETKRSATTEAEELGILDAITIRMNDKGRGFLL